MKKTNKWIAAILILVLFSNCASKGKPDNFVYGSVNDNIYSNEYFKCKMKLPENWIIQSQEQTEQIADMGKNLVAGDDKTLESALNASEINTANLLAVFQYEVGAAVEFNPNILIVAENVTNAPGIKNGSDYLFQSRRLLKQGQFQYDYLSEDFESEMINGTEFHKMDAHINYAGMEIKQVYYSTISNGFSFNVIVSYINDEQKKVLLESINSILFEK
jgi:hypothetical protein